MLSICQILDRLEIEGKCPRVQLAMMPALERGARLKLYEFLRANRRLLVDKMLADIHPSSDEPSFASSLFFAGFLDRLCQALQRDTFLALELWVKALAADDDFESRSSRSLTIACSLLADAFHSEAEGNPSVSAYLTMTAVELETTFVNARLQRQGTPRIDPAKLLPADQVVDALAAVIRTQSGERYQHARAVSALSGRLGGAMHFTNEQIVFLERAGLLCGIGRIGIPEAILAKPAPLEPQEWAIVSRYPAMGAAILRTMPALAMFAPVIRAHRERLDGRGYPDGVGAHDIPMQAKIISVADAFHAMMSPRPYRAALPAARAIEELRNGAGVQYDSDIVHTLVRLVSPANPSEQFEEASTS
ncbi:MAG: hypothetical protein NVS9B12_11220 [Vulcanimicrobiaceae bacterium]